MGNYEFVNVFQGTRGVVKPPKDSLSARWNILKGKAGNNSPAACLPFGSISCSPYSGGYPSGYGNFKRNGGEIPEPFFNGDKLVGFSHFTQSGTGAIGFYYNYLVAVPFRGTLEDIHKLKDIDEEIAAPGYYKCRLIEDNIVAELTVADKVAIHRYTSSDGKPFKVAVDISNDGLKQPWDKKVFGFSQKSEIFTEDFGVGGYITVQGIKLYFYIACNSRVSLWFNKQVIENTKLVLGKTEQSFGCVVKSDGDFAVLKIGFSLLSTDRAKSSVLATSDFDGTRADAKATWEKRLSTIELEGVSEEDAGIFYSNYYHSLTKPCGWKAESFFWDEKGTFYLDFTTLWDIYKTQIPLLFSLHGDVGKDIVFTLLHYGLTNGKLFNALLLSSDIDLEIKQACCLGCYVLYDAYIRGLIDEEHVDVMFAVVRSEIGRYAEKIKKGVLDKTTKLLDATLIAKSFADIAKEYGRNSDCAFFSEIADFWSDAFGADGLLKSGYSYYEGNRWNYSFRFVNDVVKRIELSGGKDNLIKQLDLFFGFNENNPLSDRFEGFNNEPDMETPYFYHYVGCPNRVFRIVRECVKNCFKSGRDGLPGNNDSGGLSSCYIWNFLGLFPVSGQDLTFIGYPKAKKATLHFSNGNDLVILSEIKGEEINEVKFNGKKVCDYKISVKELMKGGEIVFY